MTYPLRAGTGAIELKQGWEPIEGLEEALKGATLEEYDINGASGIIGALYCECREDAMIIRDAAKRYAENSNE